ncbi:amidohydrolase family-domain-containing protein [Boletus edulis]|nr:amidohydrolase family-domain-containing protein [Boletus edulis]
MTDSKQPAVPTSPHRSRLRPYIVTSLLALAAVLAVSRYVLCSPGRKIYTVDTAHPNVECIVVSNNTISDVGDLVDIKTRWRTRHLNLQIPWPFSLWQSSLPVSFVGQDSIIVPGLSDAHAHVLDYGAAMALDLSGCKSKQEVLHRVVQYVKSHPGVLDDPSRWIKGMGWDQNLWSDSQYPTADDFDSESLLRGRRIYLHRVDGHAAWVSNRVLQLMGSLPNEVDGGLIIRDPSGKPTGIFVDNAMAIVPIPAPTKSQLHEYFDRTVKDALAVGLTSSPRCCDRTPYDRILSGLRLYLMGNIPSNEYWGRNITRLINYGIAERLDLRSVKLFADETLSTLVKQFWEDGWQVNIHCIGDRANHIVLDIFEDILSHSEHGSAAKRRPRIEHAQIMTLDDLERAGRLQERPKTGVLPLGSDFPVEGINPLLGFYAAVSRLSPSGDSPHGPQGWYPSERLTRAQALKGMTLDAAYAAFAEDKLGSLSVGKKADFVVLDRDIMTVPLSELLATRVRATVIDGEVVYGSL